MNALDFSYSNPGIFLQIIQNIIFLNTLIKYIFNLIGLANNKISKILPDKFAIMFGA